MKFIWLTLPVFLAAGIGCAYRSGLTAELDSISSRSNIEVIGDCYKGSAATTILLAAAVSSPCERSVLNALRSMWGQ
jgi:hypothetical protein